MNCIGLVKSHSDSPLSPELSKQIYKVVFAIIPFPISTVATAKLSILCFYRRIFPTTTFHRCSLMIGIGVVIYWITSVLGILLNCIPIRSNWESTDRKRCINITAFFLTLELFNCLLDVAMLALALRMVQGLQMPKKQKLAVAGIFLLGSL